MGSIDPASGLYIFDSADTDAPMHTVLNRQATPASQQMAQLKQRVSQIEATQITQYREFATSRAGVVDDAYRFLTLSENAGAATPNAFSYNYTPSGDYQGALELPQGIYLIDHLTYHGAAATGRCMTELWSDLEPAAAGQFAGDGGTGGVLRGHEATFAGDDRTSLEKAAFRWNGSGRLWLRVYQKTGATRNVSGLLRLARLGSV